MDAVKYRHIHMYRNRIACLFLSQTSATFLSFTQQMSAVEVPARCCCCKIIAVMIPSPQADTWYFGYFFLYDVKGFRRLVKRSNAIMKNQVCDEQSELNGYCVLTELEMTPTSKYYLNIYQKIHSAIR